MGVERHWLLALLGLVTATLPGAAAALEPERLVAGFPRGQMVLETSGPRCIRLDIFLATTPEQRAQGLMWVESLEEFEGMYFGNAAPADLAMWMKNTPLPLDMIFIGEGGKVTRVEARTTPFSLTRIESGSPVIGVLEVAGGSADRWGVRPGTRVLLAVRDLAAQQ